MKATVENQQSISTEPNRFGLLNVPAPIRNRIVAHIIRAEPGATTSLLLTNKDVCTAVCTTLYEELYVCDDANALIAPPVSTRLATVLSQPARYAPFVKTLVMISKPIAESALWDRNFIEPVNEEMGLPFGPRQLGELLSFLRHLQTMVWASDRSPPPQICPLLHRLCPAITTLALRPIGSKGFHASSRRWNGEGVEKLQKLTELSISHVSLDANRHMCKAFKNLNNLTHLTLDSQFADDGLLSTIGDLRSLTHFVLKCSGTKITDKGLTAILENSSTLQSLELREVEARLSKAMWSSLTSLPDPFRHFRLIYSEEGPHHSWITDHLDTVFMLLELAPHGLQTFCIRTLQPESTYVRLNATDPHPTMLNGVSQVKRIISAKCDETVLPRKLPSGALESLTKFGEHLEELNLLMFQLSIDEMRLILESCKKLGRLQVHLDAPLKKFFGLSSYLVPLTHLHTLSISITERYCPVPGVIQTIQEDRTLGRNATAASSEPCSPESPSVSSMSEFSPASTQASLPTEHEAISPTSSPLTVSRSAAKGWGMVASPMLQLANGPVASLLNDNLGCTNALISSTRAPDLSIPSNRDIRKRVRRCPTLRKVKWIGRLGKGEWRVVPGATFSQTAISFIPAYLADDHDQRKEELGTGADVEELIITRRIANQSGPNDGGKGPVVDLFGNRSEFCAEAKQRLSTVPLRLLDDEQFPTITTTSTTNSTDENSTDFDSKRQTSSSPVALPTYASQASIWDDIPNAQSSLTMWPFIGCDHPAFLKRSAREKKVDNLGEALTLQFSKSGCVGPASPTHKTKQSASSSLARNSIRLPRKPEFTSLRRLEPSSVESTKFSANKL